MCETKQTRVDSVCNIPMGEKESMGQGVLSYDVRTFCGKMLCTGHGDPVEKRKREIVPKPRKFESKEPWRIKWNREELKRRELENQRLHWTPVDVRMKKAMATRASLPTLGLREVRRHREPCTTVIPLELEEDGFILSASILQSFINYNGHMRALALKGSPFHDEPPLSAQPEFLQKLADGLMQVEKEARSPTPDYILLLDLLLKMSVDFMKGSITLYWITEKLLLITQDIASEYPADGFKRLALAHFLYGYFLTNLNLLEHARDELEKARGLSLGKPWTIDFDMPKKFKTLYYEVTDLMCQVLLTKARAVRVKNPQEAQRCCSRALRRLGDKVLDQTQAEVLLELGLSYKAGGEYALAREVFTQYLEKFSSAAYSSGLCIAYLEGAICYTHLGDLEKAQQYLYNVLHAAEKSGLEELTAIALRYIGESFLRMGFCKKASEFLIQSFQLSHKLNLQAELNHLRVLASIAKGFELMPLVSLLLNACIEDKKGDRIESLLMWRLHRTPFWDLNGSLAPQFPDGSLFHMIVDERESSEAALTLRRTVQIAREKAQEEHKRKRRAEMKRVDFLRKKEEEQALFGAHYEVTQESSLYDVTQSFDIYAEEQLADFSEKDRGESVESYERESRVSDDVDVFEFCRNIVEDIVKRSLDTVFLTRRDTTERGAKAKFYSRPTVIEMYDSRASLPPDKWKPIRKSSDTSFMSASSAQEVVEGLIYY